MKINKNKTRVVVIGVEETKIDIRLDTEALERVGHCQCLRAVMGPGRAQM